MERGGRCADKIWAAEDADCRRYGLQRSVSFQLSHFMTNHLFDKDYKIEHITTDAHGAELMSLSAHIVIITYCGRFYFVTIDIKLWKCRRRRVVSFSGTTYAMFYFEFLISAVALYAEGTS